MQLRHLAIVPLLVIAACGAYDKYPFPPQYVSGTDVPATSIPAPPPRYSAAYEQEVKDILAMQAALTPADIAAIQHQIDISPDKILLPALGGAYDEAHFPALYRLLRRVASDAWRIGDEAREFWKSPRPWYTEPAVKRYVEPIMSYGYPSGHTTTFGSWAYVLADLFPEKRENFFEIAWGAGANRIKGGAHYPHDIVGGKQMAQAVYNALQKSDAYRDDFRAARFELDSGGVVCPVEPVGSPEAARPH